MRESHHLGNRGRNVFGIFAMTRGQLLRAYVEATNAGLTATAARLKRRLDEQEAYRAALRESQRELLRA